MGTNYILTDDWKGSEQLFPVTPELKTFGDLFWPMCLDYHSPVDAIFLMNFLIFDFLNRKPAWIVRDGLIPLLWFFKINPKPKRLRTKLYIDPNFSDFVPKAWRPFVGTYRVVNKNPTKHRSKLIIMGLLTETVFSLECQDSFFKRLKKELIKHPRKYKEVVAFIPLKSYRELHHGEQTFHLTAISGLFEALGCPLHPIGYVKLDGMENLLDYDFLELNDGYICSDSYLRHMALSRGARPLFQVPEGIHSNSSVLSLSSFHSIVLNDKLSKTTVSDMKELRSSMAHVMESEANLSLPWPTWFEKWTPR